MNDEIKISDKVIVAALNRQTYRPDVLCVTVDNITITPKTTKWHLSDGSNVMCRDKMYKL